VGHFWAHAKFDNKLIFNKQHLFNAKKCPIFFIFQEWGIEPALSLPKWINS